MLIHNWIATVTNTDTCAPCMLGLIKPFGYQYDPGTNQRVASNTIRAMVAARVLTLLTDSRLVMTCLNQVYANNLTWGVSTTLYTEAFPIRTCL